MSVTLFTNFFSRYMLPMRPQEQPQDLFKGQHWKKEKAGNEDKNHFNGAISVRNT
jgi:hypothetical protein